MFRWLALALILGNLAYAAWQLRPGEPVPPPSPTAALEYSGVARLKLLKERPRPAIGAAVADGRREALPAGEAVPNREDAQSIDAGRAETADNEDAVHEPRDSAPEPASAPGILASAPAPLCGVLGPFAEKISSRQVRDRLADADIPAGLEIREVVVRRDHWVHIPPLASRDEAMRVLKQLQQRRIDSFLITDGDLANGISLGIFSRRGSAQRLAARHESLGYDIAIRPLPRTETQRWLVVQPGGVDRIDGPLLERLRTGGIEMEFLRQPCADVAPAAQLD